MPLDIKKELTAMDLRDHDFYDNLSDEEKKSFNPYVLMRFISNVKGEKDFQEWFIEMTNNNVNKHHWILSKHHKELLWKLTASIGIGKTMYHPYLAASKKQTTNKIEKLIEELHPSWKLEDIKLYAALMTDEDKKELFDKMGFDKKQRKEYE